MYSASFILLLVLLDRFAFCGIENTQTNYLTGVYSPGWNAGLSPVQASSFVSGSSAISYVAPFLGGILADGIFGDYWSILVATMLLYMPGLLLIVLTTVPGLLGQTFDVATLFAGMLSLYPLGAGILKSVINVFGAKQFHPVLQSSMIESFFVNFYMALNIGALFGGILVPLLAQKDITLAYLLPFAGLALGILVFVQGTKRYVRVRPDSRTLSKTLLLLGSAVLGKPFYSSKKSNGGPYDDSFVNGVKQLLSVVPVASLTLPFNIAYSQMITVYVVQGSVMRPLSFIDSSMMINVNAVGVLIAGFFVDRYLFPSLSKRGCQIPFAYKFAIGTALGGLSILSAILVDYWIHSAFNNMGQEISVVWQTFQYLGIGAGEVFASAAAYEAAFAIAPKEQKGLASAINLFCMGGLPNFICIILYNSCRKWFPQGESNDNLEAYSKSQVYLYLWVLLAFSVFGVMLNLSSRVKNWLENLCKAAVSSAACQSRESLEKRDMAGEGSDLSVTSEATRDVPESSYKEELCA